MIFDKLDMIVRDLVSIFLLMKNFEIQRRYMRIYRRENTHKEF